MDKNKQAEKMDDEKNNMELGKFYFLNNKFDEAVSMFNKVIETNPANAEAYYNIGIIKESSNNIEEAKRMYQKALNINKDYKIAADKLNNLMGIGKDE